MLHKVALNLAQEDISFIRLLAKVGYAAFAFTNAAIKVALKPKRE